MVEANNCGPAFWATPNQNQLAELEQRMNMVLHHAAKLALNKNDLKIVKSLNNPPPGVAEIFQMLHAFKHNLNLNRVDYGMVRSKDGILAKPLDFADLNIDNLSAN